MVFSYLAVTGATYNNIIMIVGAALNKFTISEAVNIIIGAGRYLSVKKTSFTLKKKFAATSNRRKHYNYKKQKKSSILVFMRPLTRSLGTRPNKEEE